jgi:hypothetical protein
MHAALVQFAAPDLVIAEVFDGEHVVRIVEVVERGHVLGICRFVGAQHEGFTGAALAGHRPARIGAHVRQRLLENERRAGVVANDEHEVQVSVADLDHVERPVGADARGQRGPLGEVGGHGVEGELAEIGVGHDGLSGAGIRSWSCCRP